MATVISNDRIASDCYILTVQGKFAGSMGQFYMIRSWRQYPLLSRPISIYDLGDGFVSFLYRVVGLGTQMLSELRTGDEVELAGPFGNGFPSVQGKVALVGGGMGAAPLYYAAKQLQATADCHIYLGFSKEPFGVEAYQTLSSHVVVNIGGSIVADVDPADYDFVFTCGPQAMMKALADKAGQTGSIDKVFISTESRMACGIGACLACSCETAHGNRKVCKDGPVFPAKEVMFDAINELQHSRG